MVRRRWHVWVATLIVGCTAYDPSLLQPPSGGDSPLAHDGGRQDAEPPAGRDGGDQDAESPDAADAAGECVPNSESGSCPVMCPERCNELDDDCDGEVDEGDVCTADCASVSTELRQYFFCPSEIGWSSARSACALLDGQLASIEDPAEGDLLALELASASWIGHNQLTRRGVWTWVHNGVPFWSGASDGAPISERYADWAEGSPDGAGDCGVLEREGVLDDRDCAELLPFVCEVGPDGCAEDPDKRDPGQCGCGAVDLDADGDAFAACNDACDDDPAKLVPGLCGCGIADLDADDDGQVDCDDSCPEDPDKNAPGACGCDEPDIDSDGDNNPDCTDECPDDVTKVVPGACGCGVADVDSDGDGTADCEDLCPADRDRTDDVDSDGDGVLDCNDGCPADSSVSVDCFPFPHSNFDSDEIDFDAAPEAVLDDCGGGLTTVTTSESGAAFDNWCGTPPAPLVQSQDDGPDLVVLPLRGLSVASGHTLRLRGTQPVAFAVGGDATIDGVIDASAAGATPGAGGDQSCGASGGGGGDSSPGLNGGGGGGGGFGTAGGSGGDDDGSDGGDGGVPRGDAQLTPLQGGCGGGLGGGCSDAPGAGGGALQITARGTLTLTGTVQANGGDGVDGSCNDSGGTGGGSGGAILLEAAASAITGAVRARGGDGGRGQNDGNRGPGSTSSEAQGGDGGDGDGSGAGGGGGGYGRIVTP